MTALLVFLGVIIVPNTWSTWRVAHSGVSRRARTFAIIGIWTIPLVGTFMAHEMLKFERQARAPQDPLPLPSAPRATPATEVPLAGHGPFEVRDHLHPGHRLPILDFAALDAWAAQAATPVAAQAARESGRRAWLLYLAHRMGGYTQLVESHDCRVLAGLSTGAARGTCRLLADTRHRVAQRLEGLAAFPDVIPTLIELDDEDDYFQYVARFYPGEAGLDSSIGAFIAADFPHFVAVLGDETELEQVITHEMVHFAVAHLSLPLWLDEGLAVRTRQQLAAERGGTARQVEAPPRSPRHQSFWNPETIQEFWSGRSFQRADAGGVLSYELARGMVDSIAGDRERLTRFAKRARRDDAGAAAALAELHMDLGELAARALDAKPDAAWTPAPGSWTRGVARKA
jgi:hypothetical protein